MSIGPCSGVPWTCGHLRGEHTTRKMSTMSGASNTSNASMNPAASTASTSSTASTTAAHRSTGLPQQEARAVSQTGVSVGGTRQVSGGAPGIVREVSTSSNPGSATGSLNDKGEAGKKLAAEKEKLSIPVQNSLKRLADAKDGKCDFKMLLLCDVKLTGADIAGLMPAVKTSCLRSLSLYGSGLTATTAKQLANALAAHESLTMLDLGNNALGSKGAGPRP